MICIHCSVAAIFNWELANPYQYTERSTARLLSYSMCPGCENIIIKDIECEFDTDEYDNFQITQALSSEIIFPKASNNKLELIYIPEKYHEDYNEANIILKLSPKSSATLCRRILQSILRDEYKIKHKNLYNEINEFIKIEGHPSYLIDAIDAIRDIGNIGAHTMKINETGEIVSVKAEEAEWLIEVINALFDYTFIQPEKLKLRKVKLNEKLKKMKK